MPHWTFYRRPYAREPWREPGPDWSTLAAESPEHLAVRRALGLERDGLAIRGCALPFYRGPSRLCEVLVPGAPPRYAVLVAAVDPEAHALDGRAGTLLELNRRLAIRLTQDSLRDYLYFWLAHRSAESGRSVPVERMDQVRWRGTPGAGDRALLDSVLAPLRVTRYPGTGSFELQASVLRGDALWEVTYAISSFGRVAVVAQRPRLWALPVVNDLLADFATDAPHGCIDGWETCAPLESEPAIARLISAALPDDAEPPAVLLSRALPFFRAVRLYRAVFVGHAGPRPESADDPAGSGIFVMRGANRLYLLDGSSAPIFEAIDAEGLALSADGEPQLDPRRVLAYLGFFCRMIFGDAGPFHVVEDITDLNVRRGPAAAGDGTAHSGGRRYDELQLPELATLARPLQLTQFGVDRAEASACIQYGDALFGAALNVTREGATEMDADSPAVSDLPVNWVRSTSPYRRRGLAAAVAALGGAPASAHPTAPPAAPSTAPPGTPVGTPTEAAT